MVLRKDIKESVLNQYTLKNQYQTPKLECYHACPLHLIFMVMHEQYAYLSKYFPGYERKIRKKFDVA